MGTTTSDTYSLTLDCGIDFVRFHFHRNWAAEKVEILTSTVGVHYAGVVDLPFFARERKYQKVLGCIEARTIPHT